MKRRHFNALVGAAGAAAATGTPAFAAEKGKWSFVANVAEACTCEIPCPCNFGRRTDLVCEGTRLIEITEGQVDGMNLAGVSFIVTFTMGKWTRLYVSDALDDNQRKAFDAILPAAFGGFKKLAQTVEYAPLTIARDGDTVRFSVPESAVEIAMMRGLNDQPITIDNLPSVAYHEYVQYESVVHKHASDATEWSHKGTNGFTSKMIASGTV